MPWVTCHQVLPKSKRSIMKEIGELIHTRFRGSSADSAVEFNWICDLKSQLMITDETQGESGIIYCLSKQNCGNLSWSGTTAGSVFHIVLPR